MKIRNFFNFTMAVISLAALIGCTQKDPNTWEKIADEYFSVEPNSVAAMFKGIEAMKGPEEKSDLKSYTIKMPLKKSATLLELEKKYGTPDKKEMAVDTEGINYHFWSWGPTTMGAISPEKTISRFGFSIDYIRKFK